MATIKLIPFIDSLVKPIYIYGIEIIQASQRNFKVGKQNIITYLILLCIKE